MKTHAPLIYLSEKRLHLQRPGYWVGGVDFVEGLKDLIGRCAGSYHVRPLWEDTERRDRVLKTDSVSFSHGVWGSHLNQVCVVEIVPQL